MDRYNRQDQRQHYRVESQAGEKEVLIHVAVDFCVGNKEGFLSRVSKERLRAYFSGNISYVVLF